MKELFPFYAIGHFVGQPNRRLDFDISTFDTIDETTLADIDDPHKHTFYEIIWVDEGVSRQVIDDQEYYISGGTLFFISPGQLHHFDEWTALKGGSIFFTETFVLLNAANQEKLFELSFLDNFYSIPSLKPDTDTYGEIRRVIDMLLHERHRPDYSESIAQSLLQVLLGHIQRCVNGHAQQLVPRHYVVTYKRLNELIDQHFRESWTASEYASALHLTTHHLNLIAR